MQTCEKSPCPLWRGLFFLGESRSIYPALSFYSSHPLGLRLSFLVAAGKNTRSRINNNKKGTSHVNPPGVF